MVKRKGDISVSEPEIRFKVRIGNGAIGPGKIRLLILIAETGSISSAARECGMNYRRAQYLLETMADAIGTPLLNTVVGGYQGGGAQLTAAARALIKTFDDLDTSLNHAAAANLKTLGDLLKESG